MRGRRAGSDGGRGASLVEEPAHCTGQILDAKGLGDERAMRVVGGVGAKGRARVPGHEEQLGLGANRAQPRRELLAAHARHHDVAHDEVHGPREGFVHAQGLDAVGGGEHLVAHGAEGARGDLFYVVEAGGFTVSIAGARVAARGAGDSFGELALLYGCPRAATVTSDGAGRLWALDRAIFRFMVAATRESQLAEIVRGLR